MTECSPEPPVLGRRSSRDHLGDEDAGVLPYVGIIRPSSNAEAQPRVTLQTAPSHRVRLALRTTEKPSEPLCPSDTRKTTRPLRTTQNREKPHRTLQNHTVPQNPPPHTHTHPHLAIRQSCFVVCTVLIKNNTKLGQNGIKIIITSLLA